MARGFRSGSESKWAAGLRGLTEGFMSGRQLREQAADRALKEQLFKIQQEEAGRGARKQKADEAELGLKFLLAQQDTEVRDPITGNVSKVSGLKDVTLGPDLDIIRGPGFSAGSKKTVFSPMPPPPKPAPRNYRQEAATLKALTDFADIESNVDSTVAELERIEKLNEKSYGGYAGAAQMKLRSALNTGTESEKFKNTSDIVNTLKFNVLKNIKSFLPGQISNAEREYLDAAFGSSETMSPAERAIAIKNAKFIIQGSKARAKAKLDALQGEGGGLAGGTDEDAQAIQWASANPDDPRAKAILRLHGGR